MESNTNKNTHSKYNFLFAEERKNKILEYIHEKKQVKVLELCNTFSVSSSTIRNDLQELDDSGLITRTHGGAIYKHKSGYELTVEERRLDNKDAKVKIAMNALNLIEDGDTIILDTGTTAKELGVLLIQKQNLTVVTNDISIAHILEPFPSCETIVIGGLLRKGFNSTVCYGPNSQFEFLTIDKAFLGTDAFSIEKGASTPDISQARTKHLMIKASTKVFLLCDHTKLETNALMNFAIPNQIDVLVTDSISDDLRRIYEDNDITVVV